jgi:Fuc2NAc and GlcNAc transferase
MIYVIGFAVAGFLLSYIWTAGILKWTRRKKILDIPNNRSSHSVPTPRGGGIAIAGLTVGLWLACLPLAYRFDFRFLVVAAGGLLVATMGWFDDVRIVWRSTRFLVHAIGAAIAMLAFGYFDEIAVPFIGPVHFGWFGCRSRSCGSPASPMRTILWTGLMGSPEVKPWWPAPVG